MILTDLPDLPPRPLTAENAAFRADYSARWGKETTVLYGLSTHAEYPTVTHPLSIKMAWDGQEIYRLNRRSVAVREGSFLVLNEGNAYGSLLKTDSPMRSFSIFLRGGLAREVFAVRRLSLSAALDQPERAGELSSFSEHLRPHDDVVVPRMRRILDRVLAGERDQQWLEEQAILVVDALYASERDARTSTERLVAARPATRLELARRLRLAADHVQSHFHQPLAISDMAEIACLSTFHFVRCFQMLYGITPHAYLVARRAAEARRLIAAGTTDLDIVAARCGFGSRSSLRRALARPAGPGLGAQNV